MIFDTKIDDPILLEDFKQLIAPIEIDVLLEGQSVRDNKIKLGCRAGPSLLISNLLHEICHFIEIDSNRVFRPGWGLKYGRYIPHPFGGIGCREFSTTKHIEREIRVWAMQLNISKHKNIKESSHNLAKSSKYLPEFWLLAPKSTDEERQKIVEERVEKTSYLPKYQFYHLLGKLNKKINLL